MLDWEVNDDAILRGNVKHFFATIAANLSDLRGARVIRLLWL